MSNVLIGIIGVILFIGLALAGALFLGPRFQSASNDSKAAAMVQQLQQASDAAAMYTLNTGSPLPGGPLADSPLIGEYLKHDLQNPLENGGPAYLYNAAGEIGGESRFVGMVLKNGRNSQEICEAVQRASGQITSSGQFNDSAFARSEVAGLNLRGGCLYLDENRYLVFSSI